MAETKVVYKERKVNYSGLFDVNRIHKFVVDWFRKNKFTMYEEKTEEQILEGGKQIIYNYKPYKKFTDFAKAVVYFDVDFNDVQDVKVEIDGVTKQMQKGSVSIAITGYVETDYENKWETKPFYYFLKVVFEKFFLGSHRSYYGSYVSKACTRLNHEMKSLLNLKNLKV